MKSQTGFTLKNYLREAVQAWCELNQERYNLRSDDVQWMLVAVLRSHHIDRDFLQAVVEEMRKEDTL